MTTDFRVGIGLAIGALCLVVVCAVYAWRNQ